MKKIPVLLFLSVLTLTFSSQTAKSDEKVNSTKQIQTSETDKDPDRGNGGMFKHQWSYGPDEPMNFIFIKTPKKKYAQHILLDKFDQKDVDHSGMVKVELWVDGYLLKGWVEKYLYDKGYYDYLKPNNGELFHTYTNDKSSSDIISKLKEEANETSGEIDETSDKIDSVDLYNQLFN